MLIGYARVSTKEQNIDLQIDALTQAGCEKIYQEKVSGAKPDRTELNNLMQFVREGDVLVVWRMDRLARSLKQLIETIEALDKQGVGFRSITENIDTTTAGGKLIFHIFGALSEFEKRLIRERTLAGLESARARGRVGGRPKKMNDEDIETAKFMLKNPNLTYKYVAKKLNVSESTLVRRVGKREDLV